jgi:FG-GAP-like repeat
MRWLVLALLAGCAPERAPDEGDMSSEVPDGGCMPAWLCEQPVCTTDDDCEADTVCYCARPTDKGCTNGRCVMRQQPFDRLCRAPGAFPKSDFALAEKCHYVPPVGTRILSAAVVADLDLDGRSEILFSTYGSDAAPSHLIALHGDDCTVAWDKSFMRRGDEPIAIADLDGDSQPEIVLTMGSPPRTTVLDHGGNIIAQGEPSQDGYPGPAIADVDGVPPAEIAVGASVYRYRPGKMGLDILFQHEAEVTQWGHTLPLFADLDGDGRPELVTGLHVYDGKTGADKTPTSLRLWAGSGAFTAVADFDLDGRADLAVVQTNGRDQIVFVIDALHDKLLFGPFTWPSSSPAPNGNGGPPTVDDFDGDGVPDIAVSGATQTCVFALRCAGQHRPADCDANRPGALWCARTDDESSGVSASTSFDLNGDGDPELIYRDECWMRIYDGVTGRALAAKNMTSGTLVEYPVVVDVDGDGHAEIVVTSEDYPLDCSGQPEAQTGAAWSGGTSGLYVLKDPQNRWMPTRRIWTSHGYHVTDIDDNLGVPVQEQPFWKGAGGWRRAETPKNTWRTPDLTARAGMCGEVKADVCNRGTGDAAAGVAGTFYLGDPRSGGTVACTTKTMGALGPGQCETVTCDAPGLGRDAEVWFKAGDDGKGGGGVAECRKGNDLVNLRAACTN